MPRSSKLWGGVCVASLAVLVLAALVLRQSFLLNALSDIIQCLLLMSGVLALIPCVVQARGRLRLFWALMTMGVACWLTYQLMWTYFEVWLKQDVPNLFAGDIVLFLHIVPLMAALALRPHAPHDEYSARLGRLDFALLMVWWVYLYVLIVIPWQYVVADEVAYNRNLNSAYLVEKIAFQTALLMAWLGSKGGWRFFYANLFGASLTYAASSYIANWAISRNVYYSGSLYDVPLAASMAWITLLALWARQKTPDPSARTTSTAFGVWIARLSMITVFSLPVFAALDLSDVTVPARIRSFRLTLTLGAALVMGVMIFVRQRLLDQELRQLLTLSRDSFANLKRLQAQLIESEKLASLGQLVGGAAHELNNPLTAMMGYSDLLLNTPLATEQRALALKIGQQIRRTKSLVASLLSFARQGPASKAALDLNALLRTAIKLSQAQWQAVKIDLRSELQPDLPPVFGDSTQLLQILMRILGNALEASDRLGAGPVAVSTHHHAGVVSLTISHSALPLSESADSDSDPGIGTCHRILQEHQGRMLEKREQGRIEVSVELPASPAAEKDTPNGAVPALWQSQPSV